jgi:WD40 repeat protein
MKFYKKETIILLLLFLPFMLFASNAILKLDTKGHTSLIRDIIVTKNQNIISASDDKTIRVWDKFGHEKRKILGQIGAGNEGKIYAIALTHNEKYLAVGGFMNTNEGGISVGQIRIYNYCWVYTTIK